MIVPYPSPTAEQTRLLCTRRQYRRQLAGDPARGAKTVLWDAHCGSTLKRRTEQNSQGVSQRYSSLNHVPP